MEHKVKSPLSRLSLLTFAFILLLVPLGSFTLEAAPRSPLFSQASLSVQAEEGRSPFAPEQSDPYYGASKEAARIIDIAMGAAREYLRQAYVEEITEQMVIDHIVQTILDNGGDPYVSAFWSGETDDTEDAGLIVVSGAESSKPHGNYDDDEVKVIIPGEVVVIDIGARYLGRCSDETRTFFMGEPNQLKRDIYQIVLDAHDLAAAEIDEFVQVKVLDKTARDHITAHGYGDQFTHSVGHGVGYYIHEPPLITQTFPAGEQPLRELDVITIEPGIYISDPEMGEGEQFGMRIEDDYGVIFGGSEQITHFPTAIEEMIIRAPDDDGQGDDDDDSGVFGGDSQGTLVISAFVIMVAVAGALVVYKRGQVKDVEKL